MMETSNAPSPLGPDPEYGGCLSLKPWQAAREGQPESVQRPAPCPVIFDAPSPAK